MEQVSRYNCDCRQKIQEGFYRSGKEKIILYLPWEHFGNVKAAISESGICGRRSGKFGNAALFGKLYRQPGFLWICEPNSNETAAVGEFVSGGVDL